MIAARQRIDSLSKPLGSLGKLEEYAVQLAGIRGYMGGTLQKRCVLVFAADNGIYEEGITPVPQDVTPMQTVNIANGAAGVNALAGFTRSRPFFPSTCMLRSAHRRRMSSALIVRLPQLSQEKKAALCACGKKT